MKILLSNELMVSLSLLQTVFVLSGLSNIAVYYVEVAFFDSLHTPTVRSNKPSKSV